MLKRMYRVEGVEDPQLFYDTEQNNLVINRHGKEFRFELQDSVIAVNSYIEAVETEISKRVYEKYPPKIEEGVDADDAGADSSIQSEHVYVPDCSSCIFRRLNERAEK